MACGVRAAASDSGRDAGWARSRRAHVLGGLALAVGCSSGPPLDQCSHGRFHADCGGVGESVVGCDTATGECRWFAGGVVAAGHVTSTCPAEELCCVPPGWPFGDWRPVGALAAQAQNDIGLLRNEVVSPDLPTGVPVVFDYTGSPPPPSRFRCGGSAPVCSLSELRVFRSGDSLVVHAWSSDARHFLILEVALTSSGARTARVFHGQRGPLDMPPSAYCGGSGSDALEAVGEMRLAPGSLEAAPTAAHGLFEADLFQASVPFGHLRFEF